MINTQIIKIVVEQHPDTYVAYPLGINGAVVAEGDTADEALENAKVALQEFVDTFGQKVFQTEQPVMNAFLGETRLKLSR